MHNVGWAVCSLYHISPQPVSPRNSGAMLLEASVREMRKDLNSLIFLSPRRFGNIGMPLSSKVPSQTFRLSFSGRLMKAVSAHYELFIRLLGPDSEGGWRACCGRVYDMLSLARLVSCVRNVVGRGIL